MLRIWAVIAGLILLAPILGQPPAAAAAPVGAVSSAALKPAPASPGTDGGTAPVPQIMQVYVMASGGPAASGAGGNAAAAQGPGGLESQGTAFYLQSGGKKVIVAPYHAWAMAGASIGSGEVYLAGETCGTGKWTWWNAPAKVLGADPAADVVFLAVPPELTGVHPLTPAATVEEGDRLHGSGYAGGAMQPNGFSAPISYCGAESEEAGGGEGSWKLTFQGYGLQGSGVEPGDSGSPALTSDGRVAGEVVAAGNGWILVVPAAAIQQGLSTVPAA